MLIHLVVCFHSDYSQNWPPYYSLFRNDYYGAFGRTCGRVHFIASMIKTNSICCVFMIECKVLNDHESDLFLPLQIHKNWYISVYLAMVPAPLRLNHSKINQYWRCPLRHGKEKEQGTIAPCSLGSHLLFSQKSLSSETKVLLPCNDNVIDHFDPDKISCSFQSVCSCPIFI